MLKSNYFIINKRPQPFSEMRMAGRNAVFTAEDGRVLDYGVLPLDDSVYTILGCEEARLIMLVIDRQGERKVDGVIWTSDEGYEAGAAAIREASGRRISRQDIKISGYAWSIAKKLDEGVRIKVTDAVDAGDMEVCPECGMLNPKGSPYCLECGADL